MTQTFPFTDPNPGWGPGKKLGSADMATVSANAAQAADGLLWSDIALVKNWTKTTVTNAGVAIFWDDFLDRWITAGDNAGVPVALASHDGRDDWFSMTVPAGTNWNLTGSGASNGVGTLVIGGGGGTATASKIRQSADGGDTWNARSMTASSTEKVTAMAWFPGASLFVAGLSSTAATNIETSPDGITWTQRTAPNANARSCLAANGSVIVALASVNTNKAIFSLDGVTWTESTLPASATWSGVAWSARSRKFMAIGSGGHVATSTDGNTWSASGLTSPFPSISSSLATFGRIWVAAGSRGSGNFILSRSVDDGVSWSPIKSTAAAGGVLAAGDNQIVFVNSGVAYASLRGGL